MILHTSALRGGPILGPANSRSLGHRDTHAANIVITSGDIEVINATSKRPLAVTSTQMMVGLSSYSLRDQIGGEHLEDQTYLSGTVSPQARAANVYCNWHMQVQRTSEVRR